MYSDPCDHAGGVETPIVRGGELYWHPNGQHTAVNVLREMFLQVAMDYHIADPSAMTATRVRLFYRGLIPTLMERTKSK